MQIPNLFNRMGIDNSTEEELDYFYIEALEDDSTISCENFNASYNLSSSLDGVTWTALTGSTVATGVNSGTKIYLAGNTTTLGSQSSVQGCSFTSDKNYKLGGKLISLFSNKFDNISTNSFDLKKWQYANAKLIDCDVEFDGIENLSYAFANCSNLSALSDNFKLSGIKYLQQTFDGCSNLVNLPSSINLLDAISINNIFHRCSNLSSLPNSFYGPNVKYADYMCSQSKVTSIPDGFNLPNIITCSFGFASDALSSIGDNVKIANGPNAASYNDDDFIYEKNKITSIGDNFEYFTNVTFNGTWDPSLGIRNVFPNATSVGSGWKVYDHHDGE